MYKIILLAMSVVTVAKADPYYNLTNTLKAGGVEIKASGDYSKASGRFDVDGKKVPFGSNEGFSFGQGQVSAYYGLTSRIQFGVGVRARSVQNTVTNTSVNPEKTIDLKKSGAESLLAHVKFSSEEFKGIQLSAEGYYRTSAYSNPTFTASSPYDFIVLGDNGPDFAGGFGLSFTSKQGHYFSARSMYRKPGRDLSSELLTHLEYAWSNKTIAIVAGTELVSSMKKDAYTQDPQNKPAIGTGSSYYFNSVNRSWAAPYVGVSWAITPRWRIETRGTSVITGISTDKLNTFSVTLAYRNEDKKAENKIKDEEFKDYSIEGEVTKVSEDEKLLLLDIGLSDGVEKGMRFELFRDDYKGGNSLIASGFIVKVGSSSSAMKVVERIRPEIKIEKGLTARGGK